MGIKFVYQLEGPIPPEKEELGHWGFSALLDRKFAVKLREIELDQRNCDRLNQEGCEIITGYGLNDMGVVTPYGFVNDSWLVHGIEVPGDSCDLSLKCMDRESFFETGFEKEKELIKIQQEDNSGLLSVRYDPHNVDNMKQAFCLASLFTHWANQANIVFNSD